MFATVSAFMAVILPFVILVDLVNGGSFNSYVTNNSEILSDGVATAIYWVTCCVISWCFFKRVNWIRYAVVLIYTLHSIYLLFTNSISFGFFVGVLGVLLPYWYLFKKANVVKYFESNYNQALNEEANNSSAY